MCDPAVSGSSRANGPIPEYERAILEDGVVTPQEMDAAHSATVDYLVNLNLDGLTIQSRPPHWTPEQGTTLEWTPVIEPPSGVDWEALADARAQQAETCSRQHIWFLNAAWQDQLNFGAFEPIP